MSAPLPPSTSLLEARLGLPAGELVGVDRTRADAALFDATANALSEVPATIATTWRASAPDVVLTVVLKAARREYENPQGFTSEGVLGGFSASVETTSGAELTASEKATIAKAVQAALPALSRFSGTGSVRTPSAYA